MFSKHKTETSPVAKTLGSAARIFAAAVSDEANGSAVLAVAALGRFFKMLGVGQVRVKEENASQAEHKRGARVEDLRDE